MTIAVARRLSVEVLKVLGLSHENVRQFDIRFRPDEVVVVAIEYITTDERLMKAVELITEHHQRHASGDEP